MTPSKNVSIFLMALCVFLEAKAQSTPPNPSGTTGSVPAVVLKPSIFKSGLGAQVGYHNDPHQQVGGIFGGASLSQFTIFNPDPDKGPPIPFYSFRYQAGPSIQDGEAEIILSMSDDQRWGFNLDAELFDVEFDEGIIVSDKDFQVGVTYLISSNAKRAILLGIGLSSIEHSLYLSENQQREDFQINPADDAISDQSNGLQAQIIAATKSLFFSLEGHQGFWESPETMMDIDATWKINNRFSVIGRYNWVRNQSRDHWLLEEYLNADRASIELKLFR